MRSTLNIHLAKKKHCEQHHHQWGSYWRSMPKPKRELCSIVLNYWLERGGLNISSQKKQVLLNAFAELYAGGIREGIYGDFA